MSTHRIGAYRIVVREGYRAAVYRGRKLVSHYVIAPPAFEIALGIVTDSYVAEAAAEAARAKEGC